MAYVSKKCKWFQLAVGWTSAIDENFLNRHGQTFLLTTNIQLPKTILLDFIPTHWWFVIPNNLANCSPKNGVTYYHHIYIYIYKLWCMMYISMYVTKHSPEKDLPTNLAPKRNNAYHYDHFSLIKKAAVFHGIPRFPPQSFELVYVYQSNCRLISMNKSRLI